MNLSRFAGEKNRAQERSVDWDELALFVSTDAPFESDSRRPRTISCDFDDKGCPASLDALRPRKPEELTS
jgi:hypothetical protein